MYFFILEMTTHLFITLLSTESLKYIRNVTGSKDEGASYTGHLIHTWRNSGSLLKQAMSKKERKLKHKKSHHKRFRRRQLTPGKFLGKSLIFTVRRIDNSPRR